HQSTFLRAGPCEVVTAPCPSGHFISFDIVHLKILCCGLLKPVGTWHKCQSHPLHTAPPEIRRAAFPFLIRAQAPSLRCRQSLCTSSTPCDDAPHHSSPHAVSRDACSPC